MSARGDRAVSGTARQVFGRAIAWRRAVQVGLLGLFAAYLAWPDEVVPGEAFFRLDGSAIGAAALAARIGLFSLLFAAALLVLTWLLGRVFCGWACPLGTLIDGVDFVTGAPVRARRLSRIKYHLLVASLTAAAFGVTWAWLVDPLCWAARIEAAVAPVTLDLVGLAVLLAALVGLELGLGRRGFCRTLCPLGALLGCAASISPFERRVSDGCTACGRCIEHCRTAAIGPDSRNFDPAECVHCRECDANCPEEAISFSYLRSAVPRRPDPLRRQYLLALGAGAAAGALLRFSPPGGVDHRTVRPPGADRKRFDALCIRCGSCVRVCPTGGLLRAVDEAGVLGFQTPVLDGRAGGCAFDCKACGEVCPTGAIRELPLEDKQRDKIAVARIDPARCVPLGQRRPCLVCYAACPIAAIRLDPSDHRLRTGEQLLRPSVDQQLCTGCGLCEHRCPVPGDAAIRIHPLDT